MLFSVIDTETTSLPNHPDSDLEKQPRTVEFGGIITDGVHILDKLEFLCNPGFPIDPIITNITGITPLDLEGLPAFATHIEELREFFKRTQGRVAHNLAFDRGILEFDLKRIGKRLSHIAWYPGLEICSVEQLYPRFGKRMKLAALREIYAPGFEAQTHRALDDVLLLHEVCKNAGIYEAFKYETENASCSHNLESERVTPSATPTVNFRTS